MKNDIIALEHYVRAANYLSAAQLYLQDNFLLERPLTPEDIKPRILGHWGTCPGINFTYAHLNRLVRDHKAEMIFVLGPGHGYAGLQANLFIEGTLSEYYPQVTEDERGLGEVIKKFSWPYGFPSHTNPGTPGAILEGGELGYSLSTAYGAILDNPNLIAACMVGDGEAETGPLATAWHLNKFIDPKTNGAVLPILHLNGYKISGPSIFGRMSNKELTSLFSGYGYEPLIVEGANIHKKMYAALEKSYKMIRALQKRSSVAPRFPMIVLKTLKGWTGIKTYRGEKYEGNCLSHQVPLLKAKTDPEELRAVEKWLRSYKFQELFDAQKGFSALPLSVLPKQELRIGNNRQCYGGEKVCRDLFLPDIAEEASKKIVPGRSLSCSMCASGKYLKRVIEQNASSRNFRIFSPDETYSNKLDGVFKATTRAFAWPIMKWDKDLAPDGRVIEMLSEHSLQGMMQGYILTGRHGVFPSYEAFVQVISSMADQYVKFMRVAREIPWRGQVASFNYILTSPGWQQQHNGFSHQNPGFIDSMLQKHGSFVHAYFPADKNSTLVVLKRCLASREEINLIVAGKGDEPEWLSLADAEKELATGLAIWKFASKDDPDIVIAAAGDFLTKEALAAITILKEDVPHVRVRFVNVLEITALGVGNDEGHSPLDFDDYFTKEKPVIFNFHGYPETVKQVLFDQKGAADRFSVHGYLESGSTTTPFDMHVRNKTSRYHLVMDALDRLSARGVVKKELTNMLKKKYELLLKEHRTFIIKQGIDPDVISNWKWK